MIPIWNYVRNINKLCAFFDGDCICLTLDDFIDLQNSPAYFIESGSWQYNLLAPWVGVSTTPTIHLPYIEQCRIAKTLTMEGSNLETP